MSIEQDLTAAWLELPGEHSHQRAFSGTACAHHANKFTTRDAEGNSIEANLALAKTVCDFIKFEAPNDVALLLDDALQKIAPQDLSNVDTDNVAVLELRGRANRIVAYHDSTVRLNDLEGAHSLIVIAKNLQQHVSGGARRKQDIVGLQAARIVRDQIFRFRRLELEPSAECARAPAQVV